MPKSISLKKQAILPRTLIKFLLPVGVIMMLLASVTTVPVSAEGYLPILEDGREWVYGDSLKSSRPGQIIKTYHHKKIECDTMVDNVVWKKMSKFSYFRYLDITTEWSFAGYYHEDDGALYYTYNNTGNSFITGNKRLDLNLKVGDEFGNGVVAKVDSINVHGVIRKRISLEDCQPIEREVFLVEGIGASSNAYVKGGSEGYEGGHPKYLLYVKDKDGNVIFTQADFRAPSYSSSGIEAVESDAVEDDRIFDLYGRPVSHPIPGTIYIRNGRKFVQPRE